MPKIRQQALPEPLIAHLLDRVRQREIPLEQINLEPRMDTDERGSMPSEIASYVPAVLHLLGERIHARNCLGIRVHSRPFRGSIPGFRIKLFALWVETEPEVPVGPWFKRFSGMTACGEGELVKTFLRIGQAPVGEELR